MKAEVVALIANDAEIRRIAKKISRGNELYKDLLQYLYETLLNMSDEKIKHAVDNNYLKYLCVRILNLSMNQQRHPFAIEHQHLCNIVDFDEKIIPRLTPYETEPLYTEDELIEDIEEKESATHRYMNQEITQDNYFDITIFKLWANGESYRRIAAKIGVHHMVVHNSINRSKELIRQLYG